MAKPGHRCEAFCENQEHGGRPRSRAIGGSSAFLICPGFPIRDGQWCGKLFPAGPKCSLVAVPPWALPAATEQRETAHD